MPAKRGPITEADYGVEEYDDAFVKEIRRATGTTRQIARRYRISKSHVAYLRSLD